MKDNIYSKDFIINNRIISIDETKIPNVIALNTYDKTMLVKKDTIDISDTTKIILDMEHYILNSDINFLYVMKITNGYKIETSSDFDILISDNKNRINTDNECIKIGLSEDFDKRFYDIGTTIIKDIITKKISNKNSKANLYTNNDFKMARFTCEEVEVYTNDENFYKKLDNLRENHNKEIEKIKKLQYKLEGF